MNWLLIIFCIIAVLSLLLVLIRILLKMEFENENKMKALQFIKECILIFLELLKKVWKVKSNQ